MSVFTDIENALNTKLNSIPGLPNIFWPNEQKEPTQSTSWIRPTLLPASSELYTLNGEDYHQGIYQIDIFVPLKIGTALADSYADTIYLSFKRQTLSKNTTDVFIQQISISRQQRIEAWWSCYVEVSYLCIA